MRIEEVVNAPWAILPEKLLELRAIYATHRRGEKIDIEAVEARLGRPLKSEHQPYTLDGTTAIIPIEGVIGKKMNMFTQISGGVSTELIAKDFQAAMSDPMVKSILLVIDSAGGTVDGTENLADTIHAARGKGKAIVTLGDGCLASAAYWIGSAADEVYASDRSAKIGSIGVVATHEDYSRAEEKEGIKVTEITAGKYKRIASSHEPLSTDGRASIQSMVDHVYANFVDAVARNRGVSSQTVADKMADGRIFLGHQAVTVGLVDGVTTQGALIHILNERAVQRERLVAEVGPAGASLLDKIARHHAEFPAKRAMSPTDLAKRAAQLQAEAGKRGQSMTNIEACRIACNEAGVPV